VTRYAIYFVPEPETELATFGSRAIGYDAQSGVDVEFHDHAFFRQPEARERTESPRRYGFHATLKAPFELAEGLSIEELLSAAELFAARHAPVELGRLRVRAIGSFLALTMTKPADEVNTFAAQCVREFDAFRAPMSAADRERRLAAQLTEQQRANVDEWGYPFVFDDFRFHMTLTGRLHGRDNVKQAVAALSAIYAGVDGPITLCALAVAEQSRRDARFRVRARFEMTGG
jgi:putative phosphonate metabolism protein